MIHWILEIHFTYFYLWLETGYLFWYVQLKSWCSLGTQVSHYLLLTCGSVGFTQVSVSLCRQDERQNLVLHKHCRVVAEGNIRVGEATKKCLLCSSMLHSLVFHFPWFRSFMTTFYIGHLDLSLFNSSLTFYDFSLFHCYTAGKFIFIS